MPSDRDEGRAEIARRGLTTMAVERVVRTGLHTTPVTAVNRARTHLQRYFAGDPWSVDDDIALAAAVGPGNGWHEDPIESDLTLEFGWKGGSFKVGVERANGGNGVAAASGATATVAPPARTLGDTFDDTMAISFGRVANEVSFLTGPSTGGNARATRALPGTDPRLAGLIERFTDIAAIQLGPGVVTATITDAARWSEILLPLFDAVKEAFVQERPAAPDRKLERARDELRGYDPEEPRQLAKIVDAAGSPDATLRQAAMAALVGGDIEIVRRTWKHALDDQSRPVRRAAIQTVADMGRSELREVLEKALDDSDACVRYYGLRGLARIAPKTGIDPSLNLIEKRRNDDDLRVRIAAAFARAGQTPP